MGYNRVGHVLSGTVAVMLAGLAACTPSDRPFHFLKIEPAAQAGERIVVTPYSERIFQQGGFLFPIYLEVSEQGIFVFDAFDNFRTKRFNWDFEPQNEIGGGQGLGPGEMANASDLALRGEFLYYSDDRQGAIHRYRVDGTFIESLSMKRTLPHRVAAGGGRLFVATNVSEEFTIIDSEGSALGVADPVTAGPERYRQVMESIILADDSFVYRIPHFFGLLFVYDHQGKLVLARRLVDPFENHFEDQRPDEKNHPVFIHPQVASPRISSASLHSKELFVLVSYKDRQPMQQYIDCYALPDGRYKYSFIPPDSTRDFKVHEDRFVVIQDSSFTVYRWNGVDER